MAERILITNARVLGCAGDTDERPFAGDVLIEGERIASVSRGGMDVDAGAARRIDVRGATVMPGLGDAHTHISWPLDFVFDHNAVAAAPPAAHALDVAAVTRTYVESGYTMIVGAGTTQKDDDLLAKAAIDAGELPGPRIVPSGPMITATGCLGDESGLMQVASDAASMRELIARQCDDGVKAIKMFVSGDSIVDGFPSDDLYMDDAMVEAAVDEADRHGAFITVHARGAESVAMSARCGVRVIHHACFLDDKAMAELKGRGDTVWVCPGMHYLWAMVNGHARPWGVTPEKIERSGYPVELEAQIAGIQAMSAAGIRLVAGGDFGHQWTRHGTYAAELQRYVDQCGLSPTAAIHTATRNFGPLLGMDVGEVRAGALADLLVVDGDPTEDIAILQKPERRRAVIKGGRFAYINPDLYP
jgi:imidazolonepropionase-like amidohydrolase